MKRLANKNQSGFTLIEILLYLSLSVIMAGFVGGVGVNVLTSAVSIRGQEDLQYNAQFASEKIRILVSTAEGLVSPAVGQASSTLILEITDIDKNPTVIDMIDGKLRIQEGQNNPIFLTGPSIDISDLEFTNTTAGEALGSVNFRLIMGLVNPADRRMLQASTTLSSTVNINYP